MTAPTRDALGRPLNPDTGLPFPSASQAQLELVEELIDRLALLSDAQDGPPSPDEFRDALAEAVVRQHGRTIRAALADLREQADRYDADARRHAQDALDSSTAPASDLRIAVRYAEAASTLRSVVFRTERA